VTKKTFLEFHSDIIF